MEINGIKVKDATTPLVLEITKRDVQLGNTRDPGSCAAARACVRLVPDAKEARVYLSRVYVRTDKEWIRYLTPSSLRTEVVAFDRGGSFSPGEHTLLVIGGTRKLGADKRKRPRPVKKAKRQRYHVIEDIRARGLKMIRIDGDR